MLSEKVKELEIEKLLTHKITDFLLELGKGFAFVGRQYPVEVDDTDYKIDLLFIIRYYMRMLLLSSRQESFTRIYLEA